MDDGENNATTMLRCDSCQERLAETCWSGAFKKVISDMLHKNIKLADGRHEDYNENFVKDVLQFVEED
ncbi:MAG: hypothetical protein ACKPKO_45095 [Candidatus Fonsibacter sp.]